MARTSKTTTTRKKRTAKAKVAPAPLFDRDPYEGWTDSELKAHAENVAAQDPLNMLRKRLKAVTGLELAETTLRGHLAVQHPFLLRAFLSTSAEGGYEAKRLVIDTAVANIARLEKRSVSQRTKTMTHYADIVAEVQRGRKEWTEKGIKIIQKSAVDAEVASRRVKSGDNSCDVRTVRRARKAFGC